MGLNEEQKTEDLKELLRSYQIIPTLPRLWLAQLLRKRPMHLTADEIYRKMLECGHRISRASVYNNLHLFVKVGLLRTLHINPSLTIYDTNTEPHNHLIDSETGEIFDIELNKEMPQKGKTYRFGSNNYFIESEQSIFYGRKDPKAF